MYDIGHSLALIRHLPYSCGRAKKEPEASETSSLITMDSVTTESSETEATSVTVLDSDKKEPETGSSDPANAVSAEYKAEVGAVYPMRYENNAVYCDDP